MTHLTDKELTNIADHQFALEFLRATLVQQTDSIPRMYVGSGSISQSSDGMLELKMYCPVDSASTLLGEFGASAAEPGQLIGKEQYFAFEGVDVFGQAWTATNIWVDADVSIPASGCIVRSKLRSIESRDQRSSATTSSRTILIVPGTYNIPFVSGQPNTAEPGFSACMLDLGTNCSCHLRTRGRTLVVEIVQQDQDPEQYAGRVVEAIGIAIGAHLVPHAEIRLSATERVQTVRSLDRHASEHLRLEPPIRSQTPSDFPDFQAFVRAYVERIQEPFSQLAGFWYRILTASNGGLENQALVLSTAIEGVLKASFPEEGKPDVEFLQQVRDATPAVKKLALGSRVRESVLGSLGRAGASTPSNALHALAKAGMLPPRLVLIWKELRNKSAHADELKWSAAQTQAFINALYACLELFYRLIMIRTGYEGALVQYSGLGWPADKHTASSEG